MDYKSSRSPHNFQINIELFLWPLSTEILPVFIQSAMKTPIGTTFGSDCHCFSFRGQKKVLFQGWPYTPFQGYSVVRNNGCLYNQRRNLICCTNSKKPTLVLAQFPWRFFARPNPTQAGHWRKTGSFRCQKKTDTQWIHRRYQKLWVGLFSQPMTFAVLRGIKSLIGDFAKAFKTPFFEIQQLRQANLRGAIGHL